MFHSRNVWECDFGWNRTKDNTVNFLEAITASKSPNGVDRVRVRQPHFMGSKHVTDNGKCFLRLEGHMWLQILVPKPGNLLIPLMLSGLIIALRRLRTTGKSLTITIVLVLGSDFYTIDFQAKAGCLSDCWRNGIGKSHRLEPEVLHGQSWSCCFCLPGQEVWQPQGLHNWKWSDIKFRSRHGTEQVN